MASYEEHCQNLGKLAIKLVDVVTECLPLQTFKATIDNKGHKLLKEVEDEMTTIGSDGLNMIDRAKRPPCAILLGTSSAGKTALLNSFLPKLREFEGSTSSDTTPMLVHLRYPHVFKREEHGRVNFLMPRDLYKLLSDLPRVKDVIMQDGQVSDAWDRVAKTAKQSGVKLDEAYERALYLSLKDWGREIFNWANTKGRQDDVEYFKALFEIVTHFDPDANLFAPYNPLPRQFLIHFLDKSNNANKLSEALRETKLYEDIEESKKKGKTYFLMRTVGAITDLFVDEDILKHIDIYDTAGVRVGGFEAEKVTPEERMHSQMQAFKNRWGFERLVPSVDIVIFILVIEEQQVDTEFQALFDECRKYGSFKDRLFIFLNKIDKAADQAIKKKDYRQGPKGEVIPDEEASWKAWMQINVMDKIRGLGPDFHNVFICRTRGFDFSEDKSREFLINSKQSPTLNRYLHNVDENIEAVLDNEDGGVGYAWKTIEHVMRTQGAKLRYDRLGRQILPYAKDILGILGAKRIIEERPTEQEIDTYLEKLLNDLKDLRWRTEEFHMPEKFGEICIQKKFTTSKQIEEALKIQQESERDTGRHQRIGQILIDKKYMSLEQVREVLKSAESEQDNFEKHQDETFRHVRERVIDQIVTFMEDKGRPIIKGNIPVESVITYLTEPIKILEEELRGIYTNKERKAFQEAVQNVMECQLTAALWNQDRLRKHLWSQKSQITSSFHIRDDISKEEAIKVTECYEKIKTIFDDLPVVAKEEIK